VTQDGDDEGILRLDRLPTADEADTIRDLIGIRKRRHMTAEALSKLERAQGSIKSPNLAADFAWEPEEECLRGRWLSASGQRMKYPL
jgi:hypothetical protein